MTLTKAIEVDIANVRQFADESNAENGMGPVLHRIADAAQIYADERDTEKTLYPGDGRIWDGSKWLPVAPGLDAQYWMRKFNEEVNTHAEVMRENAQLRGELRNGLAIVSIEELDGMLEVCNAGYEIHGYQEVIKKYPYGFILVEEKS